MYPENEIFREGLDELAGHYKEILTLLGEDPNREGLEKTPMRVAKAMQVLTRGYEMDAHQVLRDALFKEDYSQMVIVKDIDFFSLCEHHILPFYGKVHVAYIPNGYITGLSKIARVVDIFSHRLQVQERMTLQIKECIEQTLHPLGVMVVVGMALIRTNADPQLWQIALLSIGLYEVINLFAQAAQVVKREQADRRIRQANTEIDRRNGENLKKHWVGDYWEMTEVTR